MTRSLRGGCVRYCSASRRTVAAVAAIAAAAAAALAPDEAEDMPKPPPVLCPDARRAVCAGGG
eukprot:35139-Chlamydomonas_euryale.AAC.6